MNEKMIGLGNQLKELQDWVLSGKFWWEIPQLDVMAGKSELELMLIAGMAGIGKSTFVDEVYRNPLVVKHFDRRLFLRIGPNYDLKETLTLALDQIGVEFDEMRGNNVVDEQFLGDCVRRYLRYRRYLVVLDDVWSIDVWNVLERFFLHDGSGSRVVLTSRLLDLTRRVDVVRHVLRIPFLNENESWNLLHDKVFGTNGEICSRQLEKIGRKIAKKCEGLPLAIIEVAELLCGIEKTVENWKALAEKEDPLTIDEETPLSKALILSYTMLPQYLKVCFLYMSVFVKKYDIRRSKLIKLWVSEGFLEPQTQGSIKSLEETADEYLNELISQSVVLSKELRFIDTKATKICRLHFTFRNLCVNEAKREKFLHIINKYDNSFPDDIDSQQRLCAHNNIVLGFSEAHSWMELVPDTPSLLCFGPQQQYPIELYLGFRLLKVLDAVSMRFYEFPHRVMELVQLRYLAVKFNGELPSSISRLSNLEVLIIHWHHRVIKSSIFPVYLPVEIWKLHKLKHLECMGFDLPDPSPADDDSLILEKLITLSGVSADSCTKRILSKLPNLMKLGIRIELAHDSVETFSFIGDFASLYEEFESFKCIVVNPIPKVVSLVPINFPVNIKKISLSGCGFPWEYMRVIAALPNLVALKLRCYAFCGPEWGPYEGGGFPQLKYLLMEDLDVQRWRVTGVEFPLLERVIVRHCYKLKEIPPGIENTSTLEMIEVDNCSPSVVISAQTIQDSLLEWGCRYFRLVIRSPSDDDDKKLKS
ncbi:hypothetical protein ACP275_09G012500 [Erythranthe tilingii]